MIFFHPAPIDAAYRAASQIRPVKMIRAFESIGYHVDSVIGYGGERKKQIEKIRKNINGGMHYAFMYAENTTGPSLLNEADHIPRYPLMDFYFMRYCRKKQIKIGIFYRDIYWIFDSLMRGLPLWKRKIVYALQRYDLFWYKRLADILYLPSVKMRGYIPADFGSRIKELPPAADAVSHDGRDSHGKGLSVFYVGGIGGAYNLKLFMKAAAQVDGVRLTVCCRREEWQRAEAEYKLLAANKNVRIVHAGGADLDEFYRRADVACLFLEPHIYRKFAMPMKLFEYIGHKKPVIAAAGTAAADFVDRYKIGWTTEYKAEAVKRVLGQIAGDMGCIKKYQRNIETILAFNTWEARARQVEAELR